MKQQYQIVSKKVLTPEISQISVHAPLVAAKAKAGQFIILRVDGNGERIPLTIAAYDREAGTISIGPERCTKWRSLWQKMPSRPCSDRMRRRAERPPSFWSVSHRCSDSALKGAEAQAFVTASTALRNALPRSNSLAKCSSA